MPSTNCEAGYGPKEIEYEQGDAPHLCGCECARCRAQQPLHSITGVLRTRVFWFYWPYDGPNPIPDWEPVFVATFDEILERGCYYLVTPCHWRYGCWGHWYKGTPYRVKFLPRWHTPFVSPLPGQILGRRIRNRRLVDWRLNWAKLYGVAEGVLRRLLGRRMEAAQEPTFTRCVPFSLADPLKNSLMDRRANPRESTAKILALIARYRVEML